MRRPCMSVNATTTVSISWSATDFASFSLVSNQLVPRLRWCAKCSILLTVAPRPGDKALEELARPGQVGGELLRVALHRDDETVIGLDAFNGPVLAARRLLQPLCKPLDRLVVEAVDADLVLAGRPAQLGCWIDLDGVRQVAPPQRADLVTLQVLHQRAAHGDVDHLLPAADAEHRDGTLPGLAKHRQLCLVKLGVGFTDLVVAPLTI